MNTLQGWLKKGTKDEQKKKGFLRSSTRWKKKFCALCKMTENGTDIAYLCIFDKETNVTEISKEFLKLWPHYRVSKKHDPSGKNHEFQVKTTDEVTRFMAESVTMMDLWVFYIQIQTKMHPNFAGEFFEVVPVDSDSVRRIGAKGSRCLIHLSKWGLTLALKRTRVVVAQWPLKCVREFESSETGMFSFDAGRNSPMGQAHYAFTTSPGEDGKMYDVLDLYTTEIMQSRPSGPEGSPSYQEVTEEEVIKDYESLRLATFGLLPVKPRSRASQLPALPPVSSRSVAVPVPVPGRSEYNHLQRQLSEINPPELPNAAPPPRSPLRRNNSQPQRSPRAPPLPLATHPVLGSKMVRSASTEILASESSPELQVYTDMSPANTLERPKGASSSTKESAKLPPRVPLDKQPPVTGAATKSLMSKSPYYNILVGSYENCPLISPSPADRFAFTNDGFISSPGSVPLSPPNLAAAVRRDPRRGNKHGSRSFNPTPITHTYYEHGLHPTEDPRLSQSLRTRFLTNPSTQFDPAVLYAKVNKSLRKALSADNLKDLEEMNDRRVSVASRISVPQRLSGISLTSDRLSIASNRVSIVSLSFEDSSPLIGSLDLAGIPHTTPSWLGFRDLPNVPHSSESPEFNVYCKTPNSNMSYGTGGFAAASHGSHASSGSKQYEDIDKLKMMYEDMNRRRSEINTRVENGERLRDAVVIRSDSASQQQHIAVTSPKDTPVVVKGTRASAGSSYENDAMLVASFEEGKSLRRVQSTGDLLDSPSNAAAYPESPLNAGKLTFMKRFQSIPSIVATEKSNTIGTNTASGREEVNNSKQKGKKRRSWSKDKDKGKAFSGRDGKVVTSGKTKTFTRQAAFSSTTSLDTISINSQMSGRELPARPSMDLSNVKEGTYEDIDDDDNASQRRFSETRHKNQHKNQSHLPPGERRNTAPSVNKHK
ncbi:hypothetical protein BSL78_04796 [Apostichopus japonicus]|uniref:PH domain-containing protein n=1 Tax=Stichopus japonicus TaxID=307972 RepID=A0A2G8LDQ2_STIJA|nr:hypothetical protein BSL78_04796 [Apostichopus japonicus]